ncbi:MAG: hypothetical protein JO102_01535 [Elusimicrobia bacterium]|nr:hypothetical protein [Elusimicrobiota bacterium]
MGFWKAVGLVAGAAMPLFNIPLILRIIRRRSCGDLSLGWLWGVWGCIVLMFPSAATSRDVVLRAFGWSNLVLFSGVVAVVCYVRRLSAVDASGNVSR